MTLKPFALAALLVGSIACNQSGAPQTDKELKGTTPADANAPAATPGATAGSAASAAKPADTAKPADPAKPAQMMMEMTLPANTPIEITLETSVGSATSKAEEAVRGKVAKAVEADGMTVIPAGAPISGTVVEATPSGRVKGRASVAIRFNRVTVANTPYDIRTARIVREAEATKGKDAEKIGIGAGVGTAIGAIAGGKKGAAIGAGVGAGAGTGAVLATKGKEVSIGVGATVRTTLEEPVKINAPM